MMRAGTHRAAVLLLALGGCAGTPKTPQTCDQLVQFDLRASARINPGDEGAASPVLVRVYQLKQRAKFDSADFRTVWQDDAAVLDGDVLEKSEVTLFPETREQLSAPRKPEAAFAAVAAIFRKPAGNDWRRVFALPDPAVVQKRCASATGQPGTRTVVPLYHRLDVDGSKLETKEIGSEP